MECTILDSISLICHMESALLTVLTSLADTTSWWYCIDTGPEDHHSLSNLLCISLEELNCVLSEVNWSRKRVSKATGVVSYQFCNDEVVEYLSRFKLRDSIEWTKRFHDKKMRTFLRIGRKTLGTITIDEQLHSTATPPHRLSWNITAAFHLSLLKRLKNDQLYFESSNTKRNISATSPTVLKGEPKIVPDQISSSNNLKLQAITN